MNIFFGNSANSAESNEDTQKNSEHEVSEAHPGNSKSQNSGIWGFQNLVNSLSTKSEGIIKTYRRDLEEFGVGLAKETETLRELAAQAVQSLHKEEILKNSEDSSVRVSYNADDPRVRISDELENPKAIVPDISESPGDRFSENIKDPMVRVSDSLNDKIAEEPRVRDLNVSGSDQMKNEDEDELGWDDTVEDSGGIESEKKECAGNSEKVKDLRVDIKKIINAAAAEDDEELSWDVDEDDDNVKSPGTIRNR